MAFTKKTWKDRQSEYPTRRKLVAAGGTPNVYDVSREEGLVVEEGDALNAANLNNLEGRIETALSDTLPKFGGTLTGQLTAGGSQTVGTAQVRNIRASTTDLTAGSSSLTTGQLYVVYE